MGTFHLASAFFEHTETGQAVAVRLKDMFHSVADGHLAALNDFRKNLHTKLPFSGAEAATLPRPVAAPLEPSPITSQALSSGTPKVLETMDAKGVVAYKDFGNVQHPTMDAGVRERALAWAKKMNPLASFKSIGESISADVRAIVPDVAPSVDVAVSALPHSDDQIINLQDLPRTEIDTVDPQKIVVRTDTGAEVRMPATPDMDAEFKIARGIIHVEGIEEQVRQDYVDYFKESIPDGMTVDQMASRLNPSDPKAYMAMVARTTTEAIDAPDNPANLNPQKMAASCVANLPSTEEAFEKQAGVLPNTCITSRDMMNEGDYVIVRDAAEPKLSFKRGIRVLFAKVSQKTAAFIGTAVGEEALPEMANEKLGIAAPAL